MSFFEHFDGFAKLQLSYENNRRIIRKKDRIFTLAFL